MKTLLRTITAILAGIGLATSNSFAQSTTWTGAGIDDRWLTDANWSGGIAPNGESGHWNVTFDNGDQIDLGFGTRSIDRLNWTGGTLRGVGAVAEDLQILRGAVSSGSTTLDHVAIFLGKNVSGRQIGGVEWTNSGSLTMTDEARVEFLASGTTFSNATSAEIVKIGAGDSGIGRNNNDGIFTNAGSVRVAGGTLKIAPQRSVGLPGSTFQIDSGTTLELTNSSSGASFHLQTGAALSSAGNVRFALSEATIDGTFTNTGTTFIEFGDVHVNQAATTAGLDLGGFVRGTGNLTITDRLDWRNGGRMSGSGSAMLEASAVADISGTTTGISGTTFLNRGTVSLDGAAKFFINDGAQWTNEGSLTLEGNSEINGGGEISPGPIVNASTGLIVKNGVATTTFVSATIFNRGTIRIDEGTLRLGTPGAPLGKTNGAMGIFFDGSRLEIAAGGALEIGYGVDSLDPSSRTNEYDFRVGSTLDNQGELSFVGGNTRFDGTYTGSGATSISGPFARVDFNSDVTLSEVTFSSGQVGGTGATTIAGHLDWSGGQMTGTGTTVLKSTSTLGASQQVQIDRRIVTNEGVANLTGSGSG